MVSHNKVLFFLLLIPSYLMAFVLLLALGLGAGSILWGPAALVLAVNLAGARLLSHRHSLVQNLLGLLCFVALGGYLTLIHFLQGGPRTGPWVWDVYLGCGIMLLGLAAFTWQLVSRRRPPR